MKLFILALLASVAHATKEYRLLVSGSPNNTCVTDHTGGCWLDLADETETYFISKGWNTPPSRLLRGGETPERRLCPVDCARRFGFYICIQFFGCSDTNRRLGSLGECQWDCDQDSDCATGLQCADAHKSELAAAGLDQRKAYCNVNSGTSEVCFDPAIAYGTPTTTAATSTASSGLGECEFDCDSDSDCAGGLLCADAHKTELADLGYDQRTAYCNVNSGTSEVCYDPAKLNPEVMEESEWQSSTVSETLAFLEVVHGNLIDTYPELDHCQLILQERSTNIF
mmetsp:Transcript_9758/g.18669  ORF Transcript_9758/g.18669 Transcript_9758/m.18669 type:complete len:283 (-) Transcript_9758:162-1010(-)